MALWTGDWDINGNGWEGKLTITAVDAQGRVTGSVYGDQILGFWDDVSKKITFMRLTNPGDPSTFQTYTGYLFVTQPGTESTSGTANLAGSFEAFAGTGATAQRVLYGWYAQIVFIG
jgi:hypothetical protein